MHRRSRAAALALLVLVVLGLLALVGGPSIAAGSAADITVRFDSHSLEADLSLGQDYLLRFSGDIIVTCDAPTPITLDVVADHGNWNVSLEQQYFTCTGNDVLTFSGQVHVPAATKAGDYDLVADASLQVGTEFKPRGTDGATISAITNRVQLLGELVHSIVRSNTTQAVDYVLELTNIGTSRDKFGIGFGEEQITPRGWGLIKDLEEADLGAGEKTVLTISIVVLPNPPAGDSTVELSVASSVTSSVRTVTLTLSVTPLPAPVAKNPGAWRFPSQWILPIGILVPLAVGLWFVVGTEIGWFGLLVSLIVPLYVRLKKEAVLDNFSRGQIFGYVKANPGAHYSEIQNHLDLSNGVLAHHLQVLSRENFVVATRDGLLKRFFPAHTKIMPRKKLLSRLQRDILDAIGNHPGISQNGIARHLDESKQVVHYHVKVLAVARIVRIEKEAGETRCYLTEQASPEEEQLPYPPAEGTPTE